MTIEYTPAVEMVGLEWNNSLRRRWSVQQLWSCCQNNILSFFSTVRDANSVFCHFFGISRVSLLKGLELNYVVFHCRIPCTHRW